MKFSRKRIISEIVLTNDYVFYKEDVFLEERKCLLTEIEDIFLGGAVLENKTEYAYLTY